MSDTYFPGPYGAPPPSAPVRGPDPGPDPGPGSGPGDDHNHTRPGASIEPPQVAAFIMPLSNNFGPSRYERYELPTYHHQHQQQHQPIPTELDTNDAPSRHSYPLNILPPVMADEDLDEGTSPASDATKHGYVSVTDLDPDVQPAYAYPVTTTAPAGYSSTIPNLAPPVPNLTLSVQQPFTTTYTGAHLSTHQSFLPAPAPTPTGNSNPNTPRYYDTDKPTCSLNLVCYRSGRDGCRLEQVQCTLASKFPAGDQGLQSALASNPRLVYTDEAFFREMRRLFDGNMSSPWRRYLSLKTLKGFRILSVGSSPPPPLYSLDTIPYILSPPYQTPSPSAYTLPDM